MTRLIPIVLTYLTILTVLCLLSSPAVLAWEAIVGPEAMPVHDPEALGGTLFATGLIGFLFSTVGWAIYSESKG